MAFPKKINFVYSLFLLFLCLISCSDGLVRPGDVPINVKYIIGAYGHMNSRIKDLATVENVDVLFLGSSTRTEVFDPRILPRFGIKSFNLGIQFSNPHSDGDTNRAVFAFAQPGTRYI